MVFVDVKNDIAFRKIFGDVKKKQILLSFLNAILQREGDARLKDIAILDPYQPPILPDFKSTIVDLRAQDFAGNTYIVEMQVANKGDMDKRVLYYTSKEYSAQIVSGEEYMELKPVIFIGVFNYLFTGEEEYLSHHTINNVKSGRQVIKDLEFYFIELPNFKIPSEHLQNITEKWVFFLKEASNLAFIPENVDDEGLKEAYTYANKFNWTKNELHEYEKAAIYKGDLKNVALTAERKGKEEGRQEGKKEREIEMAKALKIKGSAIDFIAEITGLSVEEIENL